LAGRKTRIETTLEDGSKISIVIPGSDPEKIKKFLKLLELIENDNKYIYEREFTSSSLYDKIYDLIRNEFGRASFSFNDLYRAFFLKYNMHIKKSTLSTYLSRLVESGILERLGKRGSYKYRYIEAPTQLSFVNK